MNSFSPGVCVRRSVTGRAAAQRAARQNRRSCHGYPASPSPQLTARLRVEFALGQPWNQRSLWRGIHTDSDAAISSVRLWMVTRRFFVLAAEAIEADHAPLAEKLRRASPHWMLHTHALGRGAEVTTGRDNLHHASLSTMSLYLHSDEVKRARQTGEVFASSEWDVRVSYFPAAPVGPASSSVS